jgi:probable addiction module antidote protein
MRAISGKLMTSKTRPYRELLLQSLADPVEAAHYLNAAKSDSPEMFRKALRNVAQARQMATVARTAGVTRESLYRATSEIGNPTLETLDSVLSAMGIKMKFEAEEISVSPVASEGGSGDSLNKLQTKPGFRSAVPSSASLSTAGLMIGGYDSGTALGTNAPISDPDICIFAYTSQDDPVFSAGNLQAEHSLPNATLGEKLGFLPGFLHHQQQRPSERVDE